jgi:sulfur-carrier protein adenylyltransferase/sulfurtransferase
VAPALPEISVEELKEKRERGDRVTVLDVREPHETQISDLEGSVKVPLGTLPANLNRFSKDDEIVVYCRTGGRSAQAVEFLRAAGFEKAKNLTGGINRWAERIDPEMRRY